MDYLIPEVKTFVLKRNQENKKSDKNVKYA